MQSAIPPRLILAGRLVAIAGVLLAALFAVVGLDGYEAYLRPPVAIWIALPLPLGYWAGGKLARSAAAFATVVAGLAVAFLVAAWAYWEITWGVTRQTESLAGLLFIFGPLYQYAWLAIVLLSAWAIDRIRA